MMFASISMLKQPSKDLNDWGVCQTCPCWSPWRRAFKKRFARRYISRAGIPLIEDPRKLPEGASIKNRIAILEILLNEYYLDTSYLESISKVRKRYEEYERLENDENDSTKTESNILEAEKKMKIRDAWNIYFELAKAKNDEEKLFKMVNCYLIGKVEKDECLVLNTEINLYNKRKYIEAYNIFLKLISSKNKEISFQV
ncbi:15725_t:CDS:2, partial [Cetraspora pellucida]